MSRRQIRGSELTWKMVNMTQVSGRLWECSATLKIFKPHLFTSSRSYKRAEKSRSVHGCHVGTLPSAPDPPRIPWTAAPPGPS